MKYLHIKNLEEYNPGYKDRELIWCKVYFKMINADPEFEMLCEIDKWRFIAFVMLELQIKKPIPIDDSYLIRKGFDFKKRSLQETVVSLTQSIEITNDLLQVIDTVSVTEDMKTRNDSVTQSRVDKSRIDTSLYDFNALWILYPRKIGRVDAERRFHTVIKTDQDYQNIKKALENYLAHLGKENTEKKYTLQGDTWFGGKWRNWVKVEEDVGDEDDYRQYLPVNDFIKDTA